MIEFEHLTIAAPEADRTLLEYCELIGVDPRSADETSLRLENIELRVASAEEGARSGIETVGLIGEVGGQRGRWTLGSRDASAAAGRSEVPFETDAGLAAASEPPGSTDPAAIHAVDHIVIRSRDVDGTRRLFEEGFGLRVLFDREFPDWKVRLCMCRVGDAVLEIAGALAQSADQDASGQPDEVGGAAGEKPRDRLWGVTWRVRDIEAAHARISSAGFDTSDVRTGRRPGTRVFTVRDRTGGVPTLIIQPAD